MKLPKVFVVSETQKHNIIPAADFGDIEIVLPPNQAQVIFSSGPTVQRVKRALEDFCDDDYLLFDGSRIELKAFYSASISAARRAEAFQWLRDHGMDDIIKNTVSVRFGRGEDELCSRLLEILGTQGYPAEQAEKIEPMTLKAWVKEQVERGNEFPTELFGAYIGQKAIIKS
jgi:hypothetical protein